MQFGLSESQQILKDNARKFFANECPMTEVRRLIETDTAYDANLWRKMAEQGFTGIIFPEEYGGLGLGKVFQQPVVAALCFNHSTAQSEIH